MTFDEDGSFIGQYGTLERKNMQLQKQIMSSNSFQQNGQNGHFPSNGNIPSSSNNPNNHHLVYSKSAAGGTYV